MTEHAEPQQARYFHYRGRRTLEKKAGRAFNVLTQLLLIATLLAVMLLWGGRHPVAVSTLGCGTLGAAITWALSLACRGRWIWRKSSGLWIFGLLLLLGFLQLNPDFSALMMTQKLRAIYEQTFSTGLYQGDPLLAVIPWVQKEQLLLLAAAGLWYALARQVFDTDRRALVHLALGLMAVALIAGLIGILQRFAGLEWIGPVWMEPSGSVAATWFNKNHFAQFEAMGLFLSLGLLTSFAKVSKGSMIELNWSKRARRVIATMAGFTAVVCAMGVLFSLSRTATMLSGLSLLGFFAYVLRYRFRTAFGPVTAGFFLIGFVILVGGDYALSRLEYGLSGEDASGLVRYQIWQTALSVIALAPLTGAGFAAFRGLSSHFDTSYMPGYVSFDAHNDYLDLAASFGVPLALLILCWISFFFVKTAFAIMRKEGLHSSLHAVTVGAWFGIFCALGHEMMDYGLKQGANLLMILGLLIVMTGLARRFALDSSAEQRRGRFSTPAEKEGVKLGRLYYLFPALTSAFVAVFFPLYLHTGKVGALTAAMDDMSRVPSMRAAFNNEKWFTAIERRADRVTAADPANFHAWEIDGVVAVRYGNARETDAMASSMARILDRSVSANQVWREVYRPYREKAFMQTSEAERLFVAEEYLKAADAFSKAYALNPMNGLTLSRLAKAEDDAAAWKREPGTSLTKHKIALALYPANTEVKRNAIDGYWRAWQEARDTADKKRYEEVLIGLARDFGLQVPYRLREIYPLVWSVKPNVSLLEELTPDNISALEELGHFFTHVERPDAALRAYEAVIRVNALRAEEETPETIGDLEFLRRDRRSKISVERMNTERLAAVLEKNGRRAEAQALHTRAARLLREERTPLIRRIDRAMQKSDFVLAEALIKPIREDVRAQLRMAEILILSGRYEGLRHWVADIKKVNEKKPLTDEERIRLTHLVEQMELLSIPVPDAHEFDLPENDITEN